MTKRASTREKASKRKGKKARGGVLKKARRIGSGILKGFLVLGVFGVISLIFVSLYQFVATTPYLKLQRVEIAGVDAHIMHELVDLCGLSSDISLVSLSLRTLKTKMEKHPWVRSVNLERRFPHTLIVTAEQQDPWALVLADKLHYMNHHGEMFKELGKSDNIDLPVVTGVSGKGWERENQLRLAARVLRSLEGEKGLWARERVSEVHLRGKNGVSLYFGHLPAEIRFSDGELRGKIAGLKKVAEHLNRTGRIRHVTGIDLDYEDGAVVSFNNGSFSGKRKVRGNG
ncbi:MAG: FtsQ-type POTRA domain-containing protein [Deltaproteobacteria bacterium]|nr:FtsQ-type POTRA domain-containing protein [Deltaproteobacteria bacterium]